MFNTKLKVKKLHGGKWLASSQSHFVIHSTRCTWFSSYRDQLARIWMDSCIKAGLRSPSMKHGLDIQDGSQADRYVAKWGLPEEMSKGHMKKGKNGGYTPFDLLELSIEDKPLYGGKLPSKLFQEYAIVMKGQRQLVWGRGLKKIIKN